MTAKKQHDKITKDFYVDESISEEEFDRLHSINALEQMLESKDYGELSEEEILSRIQKLKT